MSQGENQHLHRGKQIIIINYEKSVYSEESQPNSHLPIDSFFKYFLSMLGLTKCSGV